MELAVLATALAATDAALGKAVVTNKAVPARIREALNPESGLNDGLLKKSEVDKPQSQSPSRIYYQKARHFREARLKTAYTRFTLGKGNTKSAQYTRFLAGQKF